MECINVFANGKGACIEVFANGYDDDVDPSKCIRVYAGRTPVEPPVIDFCKDWTAFKCSDGSKIIAMVDNGTITTADVVFNDCGWRNYVIRDSAGNEIVNTFSDGGFNNYLVGVTLVDASYTVVGNLLSVSEAVAINTRSKVVIGYEFPFDCPDCNAATWVPAVTGVDIYINNNGVFAELALINGDPAQGIAYFKALDNIAAEILTFPYTEGVDGVEGSYTIALIDTTYTLSNVPNDTSFTTFTSLLNSIYIDICAKVVSISLVSI